MIIKEEIDVKVLILMKLLKNNNEQPYGRKI